MVQTLIDAVAALDERCTAMEAQMGDMSGKVTKMSEHIPVEAIKTEVTFSKMEKTIAAGNNASKILSAN